MTAQRTFDMDLWIDGLPNSNGIEQEGYDDQKGNYKPSIQVNLPKSQSPVRCVLVIPGGAYAGLAIKTEGYNWPPFFNAMGYAAVVLKYRLPRGHDQVPLSDALEAIRQIKSHASEWNIDPDGIGVMGFSAGGHLASTVALQAPKELRPAFQILFYPVITMDPALTHKGTHDNLLGKAPSADLERHYSGELQVTQETPRAFIAYASDDTTVDSRNAILYYEALKKSGVPSSLHIYPTGEHGFSIHETFKYHIELLENLKSWLQSF